MKAFVFAAILLLVATSVAALQSNPLRFSSIRLDPYAYAGDFVHARVGVEAQEGPDAEDVRVRAVVFDWGSYDSGAYVQSLTQQPSTSSLILDVPEDAYPGYYLVRFVITDSDGDRRVKHRWVEVV